MQDRLVDDLMENLKAADEGARQMKKGVDKSTEEAGIDASPEDGQKLRADYDAGGSPSWTWHSPA